MDVPADVVIVKGEDGGHATEEVDEGATTGEVEFVIVPHAIQRAVALFLVNHVAVDDAKHGFIEMLAADGVVGRRADILASADEGIL